tara:strand:- start:32810 stop:33955 length:1146 start_codon:yes stop_codon:yes gene_type:complete
MIFIIKKILKMIGIILATVIILVATIGILFVNLSPEFGGKSSSEKVALYKKTGHFEDGIFVNQIETNLDMGLKDMAKTVSELIQGVPNRKPDFDIPVQHIDSMELVQNTSKTELIWFGHSAFLLQMDGKNILIDPMFGDVPAPHPLLGSMRYGKSLPIPVEKLPQIDAIIISHDHYDHLDYGSIQKLKDKTKMFYVPLGVGAHFESWGVPKDNIVELDWWNDVMMDSIQFTFAPSRHFSGRGLTDRNTTLWGSWVIKGTKDKIYFSGDGGYGPHFKEIGEKLGPFDFAMIECGQYNDKWSAIHMIPEESAQAGKDVQAKRIMPIHWGAFSLAMHAWTEPVERFLKKSEELNLQVATPEIGEPIFIGTDAPVYHKKWWIKKD